ncbi:MAG: efflux RND transporter permease subunit [Chloroflexota bacterium]
MISAFFDRITRLSLRFRWVTVGIAVAVLAAGGWAMTQLNLELLPRIEFPQTVVVVQWPDAESPDQFLQEVTIPLEQNLGPESIDGVVNVESTTSAGFAFIIVRNDFGLNQEMILQDIEQAIAETGLPETAVPQVLNFSLSDLPVVVASISSGELTLAELKERVQNDLEPGLTNLERVSQVSISGGQELPTPVVVEEAAPTEEPLVEPGRLPLIVTQGAKQFGLDLQYVQDVTPAVLAGIEGTEEDILAVLKLIPGDILPYAPPETLALLPREYIETLDPAVVAELETLTADLGGVGQYDISQAYAIINGADPADVIAAVEPTPAPTAEPTAVPTPAPTPEPVVLPEFAPVALPESWIAGAAAMGQTITDTGDISLTVMAGILNFAPEQLAELTPEMWRALDPEVTAVALSQVGDTLEPDLLAQLQAIQRAAAGETAVPVALPADWVAQAAAIGVTISTTADLPPAYITIIAENAPEQLAALTPDIVLAFTPEMLAMLPESYVTSLDAGLQQTIVNIGIAQTRFLAMTEAEAVAETSTAGSRLPDQLIQGLTAAGLELEFAEDITPEMMQMLGDFGPMALQALALLTPDNLRALPAETIAWLPSEFVATLADDIRADLDALAADFGGAGALAGAAAAEAEPTDPARLPDLLIQGASMAGLEIEFAEDVTPDMIRLFAGLGEQGVQALALLTPDNLRLLQPEVIALLPLAFLDTLDADLRAELDALAVDYGGAGQLAVAEAEAAAALSADAPALSGIWLEPAPDGTPSQFQTAADILNNPFVPGAANFLNFFPDAPNVENPAEWLGALTPDVIAFLADNEEGFVPTLSPVVLELMSPETLTYLLDTYADAFDADLAARLRGIAEGEIEVFIPEASVTRTDGNPAVIVNVFKDGDANTVEVAHRVFDFLDAYKAEHPEIETNVVFEQATFIEDSVAGVSREGALGAGFAVLVILLFLSGQVGGKYRLSWRATLVTAVSIPLSIFTAFLLMQLVPPFGTWLQGLTESGGNGILTFVSRLFPTTITLNIMTLSGMTVAIGRVVDDSIVVLENSYRYIQRGDDPKTAVLQGTREVAIAIFSATATTVAVFLPLGLIGGLIGSFFLPFGLTVTYALAASFVVSITVVPALTYLLIRKEHIPEEKETTMQRWYTPALEWALTHRFLTMLRSRRSFSWAVCSCWDSCRAAIPALVGRR